MRKTVTTILITSIFFLTVIFYVVNFHEKSRVLKYWSQPRDLDYGKYHYRLSVLETQPLFSLFKITKNERNFSIVISKGTTKSELHFMHGHKKSISFGEINKHNLNWKDISVSTYLEKCKIEWKNQGVSFIEPSGHSLFFPGSSFVHD